MDEETEYDTRYNSIDYMSLEDQIKYYKNKLAFLELPEIREDYGKDYIQQQIKETTQKFRDLLQKKEQYLSNHNKSDHIMIDFY